MTLERARTDYHKEEEFHIQYPHTLHALQNLIMAIVDYQKNQGKFSLFGKDKGLKAYQKFMESVRDTRDAMIMDKVLNESASQSEFQGKLMENIIAFSTIYPNWQDAYKYAFEYFGGADANTKRNPESIKNRANTISEPDALRDIDTLASILRREREIWLEAVHVVLNGEKAISTKYNLSILPALPMVSAFQIVYALHFISLKKYLVGKDYDNFLSALSHLCCTQPIGEWMELVGKYESNITSLDVTKQMEQLCKDVTDAMIGSHIGVIHGQTLSDISNMARFFVNKNWIIVAEYYGDKATAKQLRDRTDA